MVFWTLLVYGITLIVTGARITGWLRAYSLAYASRLLGHFFFCPMCVGWWVGFGLSFLKIGPSYSYPMSQFLRPFADAFCASAVCWIIHVFLVRSGSDKL